MGATKTQSNLKYICKTISTFTSVCPSPHSNEEGSKTLSHIYVMGIDHSVQSSASSTDHTSTRTKLNSSVHVKRAKQFKVNKSMECFCWWQHPITLPIPAVVSKNVTDKSYLVCVKSEKYAS